MKRPVILSVFVIAAALCSAAGSSAQPAQNPSFAGTAWTVTPAPNAMGAPGSTVSFQASGAGTASFKDNPSRKYKVRWMQNNGQHYLTWWMLDAPGAGRSRAFRSLWKTPYSGGAATFEIGYSCVVRSARFDPTFVCDQNHRDYNFSQTPAASK